MPLTRRQARTLSRSYTGQPSRGVRYYSGSGGSGSIGGIGSEEETTARIVFRLQREGQPLTPENISRLAQELGVRQEQIRPSAITAAQKIAQERRISEEEAIKIAITEERKQEQILALQKKKLEEEKRYQELEALKKKQEEKARSFAIQQGYPPYRQTAGYTSRTGFEIEYDIGTGEVVSQRPARVFTTQQGQAYQQLQATSMGFIPNLLTPETQYATEIPVATSVTGGVITKKLTRQEAEQYSLPVGTTYTGETITKEFPKPKEQGTIGAGFKESTVDIIAGTARGAGKLLYIPNYTGGKPLIDIGQSKIFGVKGYKIYDPDVQKVIGLGVFAGAATLAPQIILPVTGAFFTKQAIETYKEPTKQNIGRLFGVSSLTFIDPFVRFGAERYRRFGAEIKPAEGIVDPAVLAGKEIFPRRSGSVAGDIKSFMRGRTPEGTIITVSASPQPLKGTVVGMGTSEEKGIYVTSKGRASIYFAKIQKETAPPPAYEFSLFPKVPKPTVSEIETYGIGVVPKKAVLAPTYKEANIFLLSQAKTGKAFITRKSQIGGIEEEAVIPAGTGIMKKPFSGSFIQQFKGYKSGFIYGGKFVAIREYKTLRGATSINEENLVREINKGYSEYKQPRQYETPYKITSEKYSSIKSSKTSYATLASSLASMTSPMQSLPSVTSLKTGYGSKPIQSYSSGSYIRTPETPSYPLISRQTGKNFLTSYPTYSLKISAATTQPPKRPIDFQLEARQEKKIYKPKREKARRFPSLVAGLFPKVKFRNISIGGGSTGLEVRPLSYAGKQKRTKVIPFQGIRRGSFAFGGRVNMQKLAPRKTQKQIRRERRRLELPLMRLRRSLF